MEQVRISIHIMNSVALLKDRDLNKLKRKIEPGITGLFMVYDNKIHFQMAEEILWKS